MKRLKAPLFYITTLVLFILLAFFVLRNGTVMEQADTAAARPGGSSGPGGFFEAFRHSLSHPLALLILQIIVILIAARFLGWLFKKIGQPSVIGEIIAGLLLGPSFLGRYFPGVSAFLFPAASLGSLQLLSQVGLILFMFVVGMEMDLSILKNKARDAVVISHASILFPFALGLLLALFLYREFAAAHAGFVPFALFTGISMSITAFPVLARIVQERGLSKTRLGTVAISCAAADDITAWCILAAVVAVVKAGSAAGALYTLAAAAVYVLVMLFAVRPLLGKVAKAHSSKGSLGKPVIALFFITLLLSAWLTETIGIHALFGAFMAGAIMPEDASFRKAFMEKVEDVALVLLLPLFFVFTGLRTEVGLLNTAHLWTVCLLIIAVAVIGKFAASTLAARFMGESWKESLSIGALMNTRGLVELIVLNIGYDLGILTPTIFTMMVIMALVTTFMTGPALDLINRVFRSDAAASPVSPE